MIIDDIEMFDWLSDHSLLFLELLSQLKYLQTGPCGREVVEERRHRGPGLCAVPYHALERGQLGEKSLVQLGNPLSAGVNVSYYQLQVIQKLPAVGNTPADLRQWQLLIGISSAQCLAIPGRCLYWLRSSLPRCRQASQMMLSTYKLKAKNVKLFW